MLRFIAAMEPNQSPARLAAASEAVASFSPALLRARIDGWTPEKQRLFCETLADCGLVRDAAAAVGMSPQSAYALRRRAEGRAFALAWNAALYLERHRLMDPAIERAMEGNVVSAGDQDEQNRKKGDSVSKLSKVKAATIAVSRDAAAATCLLSGHLPQRRDVRNLVAFSHIHFRRPALMRGRASS